MNLPQLPQDKANHYVYGLVLFVVLQAVLPEPAAFGIVFVVAWLWELYSARTKKGSVDGLDILATVAGAAAGFICTI